MSSPALAQEVNLLQVVMEKERYIALQGDYMRIKEAEFERRRADYTLYMNERHTHAQDEVDNLTLTVEQMKYANLFRGMAYGGSFITVACFGAFLVYMFSHLC